MQCGDVLCNKHRRDIDVFYSAITNCLHSCIKQCIPVLKLHNDNSVASWNDYVNHHYNISRTDFKWWVAHNRPRHGPIYHAMRMSRAQYKYALRQCRLEENSITSTKLAYHMQSHEFNDFWKKIRKQNKVKSALSNWVAGVTVETAIADMWRDYYEELLSSTASSHEKEHLLEQRLMERCK